VQKAQTRKLLNFKTTTHFLSFWSSKTQMLKHQLFQVQNIHLLTTPKICSCSRMPLTPTLTYFQNVDVEWLQLDYSYSLPHKKLKK
jgi:hypothetical protein